MADIISLSIGNLTPNSDQVSLPLLYLFEEMLGISIIKLSLTTVLLGFCDSPYIDGFNASIILWRFHKNPGST